MSLAQRSRSRGLWLGIVLVLLAGCGLIPEFPKTADQLAGEWVFTDAHGETSTMIIDQEGRFTVDRAPEEAFLVLVGAAGFFDWDETVDWENAQPITGEVSIGRAGQIGFSTREPEWGDSVAYWNRFRPSLQFFVGDVDNGESIVYVRTDEEW